MEIKRDPAWRLKAQKMLIAEEGKRATPYKDSRGIMTVGIGRNLEAHPFSDDEVMEWFDNDLDAAIDGACRIYGEAFFLSLDAGRQHALVNMVFQMGEKGLDQFHQSNTAVLAKDWSKAASLFLQSLWARQTPNRAARVCELLRTGQYPNRYA